MPRICTWYGFCQIYLGFALCRNCISVSGANWWKIKPWFFAQRSPSFLKSKDPCDWEAVSSPRFALGPVYDEVRWSMTWKTCVLKSETFGRFETLLFYQLTKVLRVVVSILSHPNPQDLNFWAYTWPNMHSLNCFLRYLNIVHVSPHFYHIVCTVISLPPPLLKKLFAPNISFTRVCILIENYFPWRLHDPSISM